MTLGVVSALLPSLGQADDLLTALGTDHPAPLFDDLLADDRFSGLRAMFAAFSLPATETTMVIPVITVEDPQATRIWDAVHENAEALLAATAPAGPSTETTAACPRA